MISKRASLRSAHQASPHRTETPLQDAAFNAALASLPLSDLVPEAHRWQRHRAMVSRSERGTCKPSLEKLAVSPDRVTPAPLDATSPVRQLLDRLEALAQHPGWVTEPYHPAWTDVVQAVLLGASPMLPLLAAWHLGHAPLARLMIERGGLRRLAKTYPPSEADAKAMDLQRAEDRCLPPTVPRRRSFQGSSLTQPLVAHAIAQRLDPGLLKQALDAGLDPNACTGTGKTLLMGLVLDAEPWPAFDGEAAFLAWAGMPPWSEDRRLGERLDVLAHAGVNLDARDALGDTALHQAARQDDLPLIERLIAHGADGAPINNAGLSPQDELEERTRVGRKQLESARASRCPGPQSGAMGGPEASAMSLADHLAATLDRGQRTQRMLRTALIEREQQALIRVAELDRTHAPLPRQSGPWATTGARRRL